MDFRMQLQELFKAQKLVIDTFIIITWLGRSYYRGFGAALKVYREVVLANIKDATYQISDWGHIHNVKEPFFSDYKVYKFEIEETDVAFVKLGDIYNSKGIIVNSPRKRINMFGLYTFNIELSRDSKIQISNLYNFFKESSYPYYIAQDISDQVYDNSPYYKCTIGETDYILPIHVINCFFYYKNPQYISHILYSNIWNLFSKLKGEKDKIIMPDRFTNLSFDDIAFFSSFFFIKGNENLNCIRRITNEFRKNAINHSLSKYYMQGGFPFKGDLRLKIIGQYITLPQKGYSKFIIYEIIELIDYPRPVYSVLKYLVECAMGPIEVSVLVQQNNKSKSFSWSHILYESRIPSVISDSGDKLTTALTRESSVSYKKDINLSSQLFRDVIANINLDDGYEAEVYEIKTHNIKREGNIFPYILCAHIRYMENNYYLLDYGFGYSIPIFRYRDATISMTYNDIENIIKDVFYQNNRWYRLLFEQEEDGYIFLLENLYIVKVFDHPSRKKDLEMKKIEFKRIIYESLLGDVTLNPKTS